MGQGGAHGKIVQAGLLHACFMLHSCSLQPPVQQ